MIYKTWQEIEDEYHYMPSIPGNQYSIGAKRMLVVLPKIRAIPELENALLQLGHYILRINFPGKDAGIEIWADTDDKFLIWLNHHLHGRIKETKVTEDGLVLTISEYINYL
jgi:hypothetical protein